MCGTILRTDINMAANMRIFIGQEENYAQRYLNKKKAVLPYLMFSSCVVSFRPDLSRSKSGKTGEEQRNRLDRDRLGR